MPNPSPHKALRAELDAMVREKFGHVLASEGYPYDLPEAHHAVALDLLSKLDAAEARVKALTAERNELKTALVPLRKAAAVLCVNADNQSSLDRINGRLVVEEFRAAILGEHHG